jgi:hypothetical protein
VVFKGSSFLIVFEEGQGLDIGGGMLFGGVSIIVITRSIISFIHKDG